ncbi:MAG: hypothetical protein M1281_11250 [Chloroflexi bacterium]|nr:hypothetical protein [Chloroflexota bacterium]
MNPSDHSRPARLLNRYQLRRVRIVLQQFEEDLIFALSWLDHGPVEGSLFHQALVLPVEIREKARQNILIGLREIRHLANTLDFEPRFENTSRQITGRLNIDWENLSDLQARKLNVFGEVHPELSQILDEPADRMAALALMLSNLFMEGPEITNSNSSKSQEKDHDHKD